MPTHKMCGVWAEENMKELHLQYKKLVCVEIHLREILPVRLFERTTITKELQAPH